MIMGEGSRKRLLYDFNGVWGDCHCIDLLHGKGEVGVLVSVPVIA